MVGDLLLIVNIRFERMTENVVTVYSVDSVLQLITNACCKMDRLVYELHSRYIVDGCDGTELLTVACVSK